jgi:hypothetical protein
MLERIRPINLGDIGHLHHIEPGGDARQHVLARAAGGGDDRIIALRHRQHERGERLGKAVGIGFGIGQQHFGHALQFGGGLGGALRALAGHEDHPRLAASAQAAVSALVVASAMVWLS